MSYKGKIKKVEKEIVVIDNTLKVLLGIGIIELILTIMGYIRFDFLSLGIMVTCVFLFIKYVQKRNIKEIMVRVYDAMELTEEEKEIKDTLEKSITKEVINEWGYNEMLRQVRKEYWSHPNAKGLEEKR